MLFRLLLATALLFAGMNSASAQKYVTIFYFSKFGDTFYQGPLAPNGDAWVMQGQQPPYGPGKGTPHFWGMPQWAAEHGDHTIKNNYIFYFNGDPTQTNDALLDWHADLLTKAGVDFVTLDITNGFRDYKPGPTYITATKALCNRWQARMKAGQPTPKIVFFVYDEKTLSEVKEQILDVYDGNLFFNYLGKKLVLVAKPDSARGQGDKRQPAVPANGLFADFTARHCWGLSSAGACWEFKVNDPTPPPPFLFNGQPEEMCAPVATQGSYMTRDGVNPVEGAQGRDGGAYFTKYMDAATQAGVKFVFIHSWNEWDAGNWGTPEKPVFVDQWLEPYSSDIEPMEGGHGSMYYDLMKKKIREFRGVGNLVDAHRYFIHTADSDRYLRVKDSKIDFAAAAPADTAQQWTAMETGGGYFKFSNAGNGKNLAIIGGDADASAGPSLAADATSFSQQWSLVDQGSGHFALSNRGGDAFLEGDPSIVRPDDSGADHHQAWVFEEVPAAPETSPEPVPRFHTD